MKILLLLALMGISQLAAARVFICVDPDTGKKTFTDTGCQTTATQEQLRVNPTNLSSGSRSAKKSATKVWNSERDTRKSAVDYNEQQRPDGYNEATASSTRSSEPSGN
jgi:hypothetical protein